MSGGERIWSRDTRLAALFRRYCTDPLSGWEHALIRDVLVHSKFYGISILVVLAIGCHAVWGYVPTSWIIVFLGAYFIEASIKMHVARRFAQLPRDMQLEPRWRLVFDAGCVYSGVIYGIASLTVFYPLPDYNRVLLIGVFCSLVCVMSVTTVYFSPVSRFMFPSLVTPIVIVLLFSGELQLWLLALLIVLSVVSARFLSRLSQNRYKHLSRLNQENKALLEDLSLQHSLAEKLQAQAEQAVIDKSRFLATASHDLRQPLHALGLFHHTLRSKNENASNHELFESIDKSTAALNCMFDSLLDVSRLDANVVEPEFETVSLESILDVLSQEFSPIAAEKGLYFQCEYAGESVITDRTLFARVLRNLISNAIKFTDSGGVSVNASCQGANLFLCIRDTGPGIPEAEHKNVFCEFYQLHDDNRPKVAGVGLGLSIVRRLCELLEIAITLRAAQNGGTEIILKMATAGHLPAAVSGSLSAPSSTLHDGPAGFQQMNPETHLQDTFILFIDDDAETRVGMKNMLLQWGCRAICVADADEALSRLSCESATPDLVMCDLQLADGSSGIDAVSLLRESMGQNLPVILISGASGSDELLEIEASGLRCLIKPVSPHALQQEILGMVCKRADATDVLMPV